MIITFNQLSSIRGKHKNQRVVFRSGVYDLLHQGHTDGLAFARSLGDIVVCGIVPDGRGEQYKRKPIRAENDRLTVIDALRDVDYAVLMPMPANGITPTLQAIKALQPNIYIEHDEHQDLWSEKDRQYLSSLGTELVIDTQPKIHSTTDIIARIRA